MAAASSSRVKPSPFFFTPLLSNMLSMSMIIPMSPLQVTSSTCEEPVRNVDRIVLMMPIASVTVGWGSLSPL
eukprot:2566650-Pyramimonas_sp.AAC.1